MKDTRLIYLGPTCSGLHSSAVGRDLIGLNRLTLAGIIGCVRLTFGGLLARWGGRPPTASMCQDAGRENRQKGSRPR